MTFSTNPGDQRHRVRSAGERSMRIPYCSLYWPARFADG